MSTAAAAAPAPKGGFKKKLVIIIAALALLVVAGGAAAVMMMKKNAAAAQAEEDGEDAPHASRDAHKTPPSFVPLEAFTVNLADRDAERYAQIGVTLQVDDAKVADEIKLYMPAIRNGVLMVLAHKTSAELLERSGKEALAAEIKREAVRPLGIELDDEDSADDDTPKKKKKKKATHSPVTGVFFSSFIVQ